ncbi:MAG: leucine-rich repeat domain-containing protein [Cytophagaceae bacterium]|nr:leucine-rich repeat domain-containing protein [Cytophagaceae bacterium]
MKLFRYILFATLLITVKNLMAQVAIPHTNFRQFLAASYPSVIINGNQLDTSVAKTLGGTFQCNGKNINDVTGIEYFINISRLRLSSNNLTFIPNIDRLTNLVELRLDTNDLTTLPNLSTLTNLQILYCRENNLTSFPSVAALSNLRTFFCDNNQLTSIPGLSNLISLQHIICSDNPLGTLPSFANLVNLRRILATECNLTSLPDLSNCTQLNDVIVNKNKLTSLPDLTGLPLQQLDLRDNLLNTFPDLSAFPGLTTQVSFQNNKLTFDDLLPSSAHPLFTSFGRSPQRPGFYDTLYGVQQEDLIIDLNFDDTITNSTYNWYKDGVLIAATSINTLNIDSLTIDIRSLYMHSN